MKCFAAVALGLGLIALPACAQHGGGHAGVSGHAGSGSHGGFATGSRGGFAASGPARSSGYRGYSAPRGPAFAGGYQRGVAGAAALRRPNTGPWRYRPPYSPRYRAGVSYVLPGYGWVSPYVLGYPDDSGYDDSTAPPDNGLAYAPDGYADPQEPGEYPQQAQLPPWQPEPLAAPLAPEAAPATEQAVTLIFKDGRPSEQIHNYLLTRTTLFVGDQHRRAIPTDELDLVATAKANQDAGVDFQLPSALR